MPYSPPPSRYAPSLIASKHISQLANMSQNIYDRPDFFYGYAKMRRSVLGLDGAAEWSALRALLPAMQGLRVLDLGCGFGWFSRWAVDQGAKSLLGLDLSTKMLERATVLSADEKYRSSIVYRREDLDRVVLQDAAADGEEKERQGNGTYDLVFSSLALHYLANCAALVAQVHDMLRPGGVFVFSVEHPIYTAPSRPGFVVGEDGHRYWPVDDYQKEGERVTSWLASGVRKQHRTVASYVNMLLAAGFELTGLDEWRPTSTVGRAARVVRRDHQADLSARACPEEGGLSESRGRREVGPGLPVVETSLMKWQRLALEQC